MAELVETVVDDNGNLIGGKRLLAVRGIIANVNGKNVANIVVGRVPSGAARFYPTAVMVELTAVAGFVAVPTLSLGITSPNFTDLIPATALTGVNTANQFARVLVTGVHLSIPGDTDVVCRISVGANATTYTLRIAVEGYYA